jgi:hypothetical protein
MNTIQLAGTLPKSLAFREFVTTFTDFPDLATEDEAAMFIRYVCEIESRRELETNKRAEKRFHEILRRTFVAWNNERRAR